MWLLLIFVLVPIIEIALFIQVGGFLGLWPTLLIVIATAFAGTILLRSQGFATMARLQENLKTGQNPVDPIAHGALILVAGVVLLTPGFFTDAVGLLLLFPPVRAFLIAWGADRFKNANFVVHTSHPETQQRHPTDPDVFDADYTVVEDDTPHDRGTSGWTKH